MNAKRYSTKGLVLAVICGAATILGASAVTADVIGYSSIPATLPGNVPSVGFEATSSKELGDQIGLLGVGARTVTSVTVIMSSWGCQSGSWTGSPTSCVTTPGATFSHPITLNIYGVTPSGTLPGALIATKTQTFAIPYRPSADPVNCPSSPTTWYNAADATCYNGLATAITFTLSPPVILPNQVVWGVAYDTSHNGYSPIGESPACYSSPGGCGYDSLNVGVESLALIGTDVDLDGIFWNTTYGPFYCDSGSGGTGTFRQDTPCWTGYRPLISFSVAVDADNDGIDDSVDNCGSVSNPDQTDSDGDRIGDACDNCPNSFNPAQSDGNGNGQGDMCDNGTPVPFAATQVTLNASASGKSNGRIRLKGTLDISAWGGRAGLIAALQQRLVLAVTGAGLADVETVDVPDPRCIDFGSTIECIGGGPEAVLRLRPKRGSTTQFNVQLNASSRSFGPPLTSSGVEATLSIGALDRRGQIASCKVHGRGKSATCK